MTNIENITKETYFALLENGKCLTLPAKGGSMRPFLRDGDLVVIQYVRVENARIGDIIAWKKDGEMNTTVHRLVKLKFWAQLELLNDENIHG